ncbi:MAG: hypothetical protein ABF705_08390, partial [Acetobacter syzygii]
MAAALQQNPATSKVGPHRYHTDPTPHNPTRAPRHTPTQAGEFAMTPPPQGLTHQPATSQPRQ